MPKLRRASIQEVSNLINIGSRSGCFRDNGSQWKFENLDAVITPITCTDDNQIQLYNDKDMSCSTASSTYETESSVSSATIQDDSDMEESNDDCASVTSLHAMNTNDGNQLINLPSLQSAINNTATCRACAKEKANSDLELFFKYCDEEKKCVLNRCRSLPVIYEIELLRATLDVRLLHSKWKREEKKQNQHNEPTSLCISSVNEGLATTVEVMCTNGRKDKRKSTHKVLIMPMKRNETTKSVSNLCNYDINIRFALALQQIGVGGSHAATVAVFLDLPAAHKWHRQFSVLEKFMHPILEAAKCKSQELATEEELTATINLPTAAVDQSLMESDVPPLARVQASFDIVWQVKSSGGKYGSATGHALLMGAITKKVMDSVVFNKNVVSAPSTPRRQVQLMA